MLISILAIFILSRFVNFEDLARSFEVFSGIDLFKLTALLICSLVARGFVWKSLLSGISLKDAFLIINEGYLFNNLIPRSGEIARIFITSSITNNDGYQAAAAIFFERALDLMIAAGMFLSTLSLVFELQWMRTAAVWIMVFFSIMLIAVLIIAYFSPAIERYLRNRMFKNKLLERRIKPVIFRAIHGLTSISQPKKLLSAFFWIIVTWCFWVMMLAYAINSISPGAPLWWSFFTEGVVALGIALPAAPANLGVYEGTIVFAFSIFGINGDTALGAAIILHIIQISTTIIFGMIGLFTHDFRLGQLIEKIQTIIVGKKTSDQEN